MQGITLEQAAYIDSLVGHVEGYAAHIYNQIGQIRAVLTNSGSTKEDLSELVQKFLNDANTIVSALETMQERMGQE